MWRAALKSALARKLRLLMSTFAIVLGVAFVVGTLVFTDTLSRSFTSIFASSVGDVVIQPDGNQVGQGSFGDLSFDAEVLEQAGTVEGAARVDGLVSAVGLFVIGSDGKIVGGQGAPALASSWSDAPAADGREGLSILEGREPTAPLEVVLDERTAELGGYEVGDQVAFTSSLDIELPQAELVGIAGYAEGGSLNGATYAAFDLEFIQTLVYGGEERYNQVWVTAESGVTQDELAKQVRAAVTAEGVDIQTGDALVEEISKTLQEALSFLTTFLLVFALISLVVGAYLIVNTFSILVAQRTRELALLRALGASRKQVRRMVLVEAFLMGVLGSVLGIVLGLGLAVVLKVVFGAVGLDLNGQSLIVAPRSFLAAFLVGVPVTMAAAYFPARRTGKISPVEALSDQIALSEKSMTRRMLAGIMMMLVGAAFVWAGLFGGIEEYPLAYLGNGLFLVLLGVTAVSPVLSRPFLSGMRRLYSAVFGAVGTLAGQNALRNPRRTTATAAALMITMALITTLATISSSTKASLADLIDRSYLGDYIVSSPVQDSFSPQVARKLAENPDVERVLTFSREFLQDEKYDFVLVGTTSADDFVSDLSLTLESGTDELEGNEVLIARSWASSHDLEEGDTFELELPAGTTELSVAGVFTSDNVLVDAFVLMNQSAYRDAKMPNQLSALMIEVSDPSPEVYAALQDALADDPLVTVKDQADFAKEASEPLDQLLLIIYLLLGLAMIIGLLGIVNTLALSAYERTREIGLLRAIGLDRAKTWLMVTLESVTIAVLGSLLGVLVGIPFATAILYALRDEGLEVIALPWGSLAVFLVVSVVVGIIAAVLPAWRAARLNVLDAIATE